MADEDEATFTSLEEELVYWKMKALEYRQSLDEVRGEFDDFQESSRELESELEAQLEQVERSNKELLSRTHRLEDENETLKNKLERLTDENYVNMTTLQEERKELLALKETMQLYIRQLEQSNDDLERGKRVTMSSLGDFESKLNHAFERNAILENELDEKQRLSEMCQRLKDECRDLRHELSTQHRKKDSIGKELEDDTQEVPVTMASPSLTISTPTSTPSHPHLSTAEGSTLIRACPSPQGTPLHTTFSGTQNFTPSTRISALNMVGDLLRKVGALESRLASCKTHITSSRGASSPGDSARTTKRTHKFNGELPSAALTKVTV